ncbi:MAG TPA: heterodisulfide reductase-related iron-sulfur binding cluster [Gaiellaceae bacterium]|nr:heterodisulfide reductase-related iron-sulfur binding cluster [Gaiellaceae bacterium]
MSIDMKLVDDCVHCGFCLPTCPTYGPLWQQEMDSPRGRIWLMKGLAEGTLELTDTVVEHFDRCLGCMACVTSCPSGVQYDRLIEQTRELIEERHDREPDDWLVRSLVFETLPHPGRLRASLALAPLGRRLPLPRALKPFPALAPPWRSGESPPRITPAAGESRGRVGLLLGCVQRVIFGDVNTATARVLAAEGYDVIAPGDQECCGALHLHAGRREEGHARAHRLAERLRDAGAEQIVVNAAGCGSHLKDAGLDVPVVDVSELLAGAAPRAERYELAVTVAFQDSCHLLHAQRVQSQPREVMRTIPGLELAEPAEPAICCGSAGIYNLVQPEAAAELGERKARHVAATGADVYASANPGCLVQVSAALRRSGQGRPALHPVELLDASIRGVSAADLLRSARR